MLWGNRNGFYYVLDRSSGEFLQGKPFVKQTWAKGLDDSGRPIRAPGACPVRRERRSGRVCREEPTGMRLPSARALACFT